MPSGTGTRARLDDGRPQAGKTGTAENYGNAWFCGYTPDIAACVWVGYRSSNKPLENVEGFGAVYGGTIPAMIWKDFMTTATRAPAAARLAGAEASDGLQGRSRRRRRSATTRRRRRRRAPAKKPAKKKPKPAAAAAARRKVVIAPQNG